MEGEQPILEFAQRRQVIRGDDLTLDDGKVDFDLVEPTRMVGVCTSVTVGHWARRRAAAFSPRCEEQLSAIVRNPKDAARGAVRLGGHHLLDKSVDRPDGRLGFASAKQLRAMHIPRGQVRERAGSEV